MIKKFLALFVLFIIFLFKPFYTFIFLIFFYVTNIYTCIFFYSIKQSQKNKEYFVLYFEEPEPFDSNFFDIFLSYCKFTAFDRVYNYLSKKYKISFFIIFFFFIVYTLELPLFFLYFCYRFVFHSESSFFKTLFQIQWVSWHKISNKKIEVVGSEIYLNNSFEEFFKIFEKVRLKLSLPKKELFLYILSVSKVIINSDELSQLTGIKVNDSKYVHLGYRDPITNSTLHATSNVDFNLCDNQYIRSPIMQLLKKNSKNPGSVFTINPDKVEIIKVNKFISKSELYQITEGDLNFCSLQDDKLSSYFKNSIKETFQNKELTDSDIEDIKKLSYFCTRNDFKELFYTH